MQGDSDLNGKSLSAIRNLKLSPDSVCDSMALGISEKLKPMQRDIFPELPQLQKQRNENLRHQNLVRNSSERLSSVPEDEPRIPPRNPITKSRPRSVSDSDKCGGRRAIFGQYWNQSNSDRPGRGRTNMGGWNSSNHKLPVGLNTTSTPPPPNRVRKRSSSMTIIDAVGMLNEPTIDYRMFAPPKDYAVMSPICGRFASVQELPINQLLSLPPLPSPLRRFCPEGDAPGCLHGMYPLITPIPILRQSSYRSLFDENRNREKSKSDTGLGNHEQESFNITGSWCPEREASFHTTSSTSSMEGSNGSVTKAGVRFDPRVTVTEFEDSIERIWYNDSELDRLKYDTILLAQEYLLTHPDQAEQYNRAALDPVTGTFRKRALFSLPVLSSTDDEGIPTPDHKEYDQLLKSQVKTILIVDPNKAILDLFCKSMHSMFPTAILYKTQSGEEALQLVTAALQRRIGVNRGFDVIIVEQRLLQRECPGRNKVKSLQSLSKLEDASTVRKPSSFSENCGNAQLCAELRGSQVLRLIQRLEDEAFEEQSSNTLPSHQPCKLSEANLLCTKPVQRRALLIGVSMQPDRDAKDFQKAGADIVWGKPIPKVGDALRNQLLHTLVHKRRQSLVGVIPETDEETTKCSSS